MRIGSCVKRGTESRGVGPPSPFSGVSPRSVFHIPNSCLPMLPTRWGTFSGGHYLPFVLLVFLKFYSCCDNAPFNHGCVMVGWLKLLSNSCKLFTNNTFIYFYISNIEIQTPD